MAEQEEQDSHANSSAGRGKKRPKRVTLPQIGNKMFLKGKEEEPSDDKSFYEEENPFGKSYRELMQKKSEMYRADDDTSQKKRKVAGKALWRSDIADVHIADRLTLYRTTDRLAEVVQATKIVNSSGFTFQSKHCLNIEEVTYLVDIGNIELFQEEKKDENIEEKQVLLPRCFSLLSSGGSSLSAYLVYSHLKRLGFLLFRTGLLHPLGNETKPTQLTTESTLAEVDTRTNEVPVLLINPTIIYPNCRNWWPPAQPSKSNLPQSTQSTESQALQNTKSPNGFKLEFDLYLPNKNFSRKRAGGRVLKGKLTNNYLGAPDFRICVCKYQDPLPQIVDMLHLSSLSGSVPVIFAVEDSGSISFFNFGSFSAEFADPSEVIS